MTIWNVIAAIAVTASASNLIPQVIHSWRTKQTRGLSAMALWTMVVGNVAWLAHGVHNSDLALVVANALLLASGLALLGMKRRYDENPQ